MMSFYLQPCLYIYENLYQDLFSSLLFLGGGEESGERTYLFIFALHSTKSILFGATTDVTFCINVRWK